jgi:predicted AAA+ superfamily ATPase
MSNDTDRALLRRIADALERQAPPAHPAIDLTLADAFVWHADGTWLEAVEHVSRVDFDLLLGIDQQRNILLENTRRFAKGHAANNALLWGARGMGKSSLIKAVHARVNDEAKKRIALVEIQRDDIQTLPPLLSLLRRSKRRCILFCDDLSFDRDDVT